MYTEARGGLGNGTTIYIGTNRDLYSSWRVDSTDEGRFFYEFKPYKIEYNFEPSYFNSLAEVDEDNMDDDSLVEYLGCYKIKEER